MLKAKRLNDDFNQPGPSNAQQDNQQSPDEELVNIVRGSGSEEDKLTKIKELFGKSPKPNINFQGKYGDTPLHIAVRNNKKKIIEFLLENGAKIDIKNNKNKTPLDNAKSKKVEQILKSHTQPSQQAPAEEQSVGQNQPQQKRSRGKRKIGEPVDLSNKENKEIDLGKASEEVSKEEADLLLKDTNQKDKEDIPKKIRRKDPDCLQQQSSEAKISSRKRVRNVAGEDDIPSKRKKEFSSRSHESSKKQKLEHPTIEESTQHRTDLPLKDTNQKDEEDIPKKLRSKDPDCLQQQSSEAKIPSRKRKLRITDKDDRLSEIENDEFNSQSHKSNKRQKLVIEESNDRNKKATSQQPEYSRPSQTLICSSKELEDFLKDCRSEGKIAIHFSYGNGELSLSCRKDSVSYIDQSFIEDALNIISSTLPSYRMKIIVHDIKEVRKTFPEIEKILNSVDDLKIISYSLDTGKHDHSIPNIAAHNLSEDVGSFSANTLIAIHEKLEQRLSKEGRLKAIYTMFDKPLMKVIFDMEKMEYY